ncbi:MAG: hypothetical protein ACF8QF_04250 [Phycisphaerales bacterium]
MSDEKHHDEHADGQAGWHADRDHSMATDDAWHDHSGEAAPQEVHGETNPMFIAALGVVGFGVLIVSIVLITVYFNQVVRSEVVQKVERADVSREYTERRAYWDAELTSYGWVDQEAGVVRIPLDAAIERVVEEYTQGQ